MNNALSNKDILREETNNNRKDFAKTLNVAAYHNVVVAEAVDLFYAIQVANTNNLFSEINIISHENGSTANKILFGRAKALNDKIIDSINEDLGVFNSMETEDKFKLLGTLAVTQNSPDTIEEVREYILLDLMCKDGSFKADIIDSVTDEKTASFVEAIKGINEAFHKKNEADLTAMYMIKEKLEGSYSEPEPEQKPESKLKKLRNLFK